MRRVRCAVKTAFVLGFVLGVLATLCLGFYLAADSYERREAAVKEQERENEAMRDRIARAWLELRQMERDLGALAPPEGPR